jgi:hypothetical protein
MASRLFSPTSGVITTFAVKLKRQEFVEFEQVRIGHQCNVHDQGELQHFGVEKEA